MSAGHISIFTGALTRAHTLDVTCVRCRRVSRAISRADAEKLVSDTNAHIDSLPPEHQARHTRASLDMYRCLGCGGTDFRPSSDGDCPDGVTLAPVIYEG